ncbi:MAG: bile acid:sodium symporter family protein [Pseudomonadota bacterium]
MTPPHKLLLRLSLLLLVAAVVLFGIGRPLPAGCVLTACFLAAAIGVRANERLRGISYSLMIFAAVTFAMCFPAPLVAWGGFKLSLLIVPLLQIIMFGMGTVMSAKDFVAVVKAPKAVGVGLVLQYTIMPFVALGLVVAFGFPPEIAAGVILVGAAPSGLASNVMAYIAHANLALSVTLTTIGTLLSPFITPLYMQWMAGRYIPIDAWSMMWDITKITILPIVAGLIFNRLFHGKTAWLDRLMPRVSMAGIAAILMIMTAGRRDELVVVGLILIVVTLLHNVSGYLLGYWICRFLRMDERTCRTISFEVGLQNAGLATGLAQELGRQVALAPVVFGSLMNITGATLATWWREKPIDENRQPADRG